VILLPRPEAPVNDGDNYKPDGCSYKIWLYAGNSHVSSTTRVWYNNIMYQRLSENVSSGDNQQETDRWLSKISSNIGHYIAGFADGEGSFNVSIRKHPGYRLGWKTSLTFNVSQKGKKSLDLLKSTFQCGYVRERKDKLHYFEIVDFNKIVSKVIPFFRKFPLISEKKKDFEIFGKVANLIKKGEHLNTEGLKKILKLREPMNYGGKNRRLNINEITTNLSGSSETKRQTSITRQ